MVVVLLLTAVPTFAAPSAAEKETARALVREGKGKERKGDLEGALESYQAAHAIMGVPTTGLKVGRSQRAVGQWVEALDTLLAVTRLPKDRHEPRAFRKARAEAKELAESLAPLIPSVQVEVEGSAADGAEVLIDGKPMRSESVGVPYKVNPGEHEFKAQSGDVEQRVQVELEEGETRVVRLKLDRAPEPEPDPSEQERDDTTAVALMAAGFGVAGAGVLIGSITGILATDQASEIAQSCPAGQCPPATHDDLDAATTLGNVSTAMFVVGAAGAVVGTIGLALLLSTDEPEEATAIVLTPSGAFIRGSF
jgi:hypothetical protein